MLVLECQDAQALVRIEIVRLSTSVFKIHSCLPYRLDPLSEAIFSHADPIATEKLYVFLLLRCFPFHLAVIIINSKVGDTIAGSIDDSQRVLVVIRHLT